VQVIVVTSHTKKGGNSKILQQCTLPLTGKSVVDTIITDVCVFKVMRGENCLLLTELRNGSTVETVRKNTEAKFKVSPTLVELN